MISGSRVDRSVWVSNVQTRDGPASIETSGTHLRSVECGTATQCEYFSREWKSSSKSCCATLWLLVGGWGYRSKRKPYAGSKPAQEGHVWFGSFDTYSIHSHLQDKHIKKERVYIYTYINIYDDDDDDWTFRHDLDGFHERG